MSTIHRWRINYKDTYNKNYVNCIEIISQFEGYLKSFSYNKLLLGPNCKVIENVKEGVYLKKETFNKEIILRLLTSGDSSEEAKKLMSNLFKSIEIDLRVKPDSKYFNTLI